VHWSRTGDRYQSRINAVLREYVRPQRGQAEPLARFNLVVPILHILLISERRGQKLNVRRAVNPVGRKNERPSSPRLSQPVIAVNYVVRPRCNFRQQNRSGQICRPNRSLIQMRALAIIRKRRELHAFNRKSIRVLLDESQKPRDIEVKDPVWVHLLAHFHRARLKRFVEFQFPQQQSRPPQG